MNRYTFTVQLTIITIDLRNLVNEPTCFKNPNNPSNINLILTNKPRSFQNTSAIETGLSDFHKLTVTVLKTNFAKLPPKILYYRNYNYFNNEHFRKDLLGNLGNCLYGVECSEFENKFLDTLNMLPWKTDSSELIILPLWPKLWSYYG